VRGLQEAFRSRTGLSTADVLRQVPHEFVARESADLEGSIVHLARNDSPAVPDRIKSRNASNGTTRRRPRRTVLNLPSFAWRRIVFGETLRSFAASAKETDSGKSGIMKGPLRTTGGVRGTSTSPEYASSEEPRKDAESKIHALTTGRQYRSRSGEYCSGTLVIEKGHVWNSESWAEMSLD
jgi:hypothetical protein